MNFPRGFSGAAVAAGLKSTGALDLTVIVNHGPEYSAASVFTSNKVVAAPVIWSREVMKGGIARAVILNSGGANACTGPQGFADTHRTAELVADALSISAGEVVVCSTGLIGEYLPMSKIESGIHNLIPALSDQSLEACAQAIMTTDSVHKIATSTSEGINVVGIAKGAGMLAPALATMLCVVMTDGRLPADIESIWRRVTDRTFNRIDSDGCTSTNDTVLLMGSGASGGFVTEAELTKVCASLAAQLMADAEGSSKTVAIHVSGAVSESDAVAVGRACARNNLLKCAIFGGDPNWGRILAAVGTADAQIDPLTIDVHLNGISVARHGGPDQDKTLVSFDERLVTIDINLNQGHHHATIYTNDLSHDYVHENSAYAT